MDISVNNPWDPNGREYLAHEIVSMGNLAFPDNPALDGIGLSDETQPVVNIIDAENDYILGLDYQGEASINMDTKEEGLQKQMGVDFAINPKYSYTVKCMVRKNTEDTATSDIFNTLISEKEHISYTHGHDGQYDIDPETSIGVGIGIKYYDQNSEYIQPINYRDHFRFMASSEFDLTQYFHMQHDIHHRTIPANARYARMYAIIGGLVTGGFYFRNPSVSNLSPFFYCKKDHVSNFQLNPNNSFPELNVDELWTQDFFWRPSYGSSVSFGTVNEALKLGDGYEYVGNKSINSMPMQCSVKFSNRTDREAKAIMHFLQEKHFPYDSAFSLDYKGERLLSSDVQKFKFHFGYPYKNDLDFTCLSFGQTKNYRNDNDVSATFICNTSSTLYSSDSHFGFNKRIDALVPVAIDEPMQFEKGKQLSLRMFEISARIEEEPDGVYEGRDRQTTENVQIRKMIKSLSRYPEDPDEDFEAGKLEFKEDYVLDIGQCLNIEIPAPNENSIFNVGVVKVTKRISATEYLFEGEFDLESEDISFELIEWPRIEDPGANKRTEEGMITDADRNRIFADSFPAEELEIEYEDLPIDEIPWNIIKLGRCPEDCLTSKTFFPENIDEIPTSTSEDGTFRPRELFLRDYRRITLDSKITPKSNRLKITPLENFEVKDNFNFIVPAVKGRRNIYIDDANEFPSYPYLKVRSLDFLPSISFSIENTPTHKETAFTQVYKKYTKVGINQNLVTVNVEFSQRSDREAKEILQFLESHLGYKKFRFQLPRPFSKDLNPYTTPASPNTSTFYCPSWEHTVVYKNNNTISCTFIESVSGINENLRQVFGFGGERAESGCFGAELYEPITLNTMCVLSSVVEAAFTTPDYLYENKLIPWEPVTLSEPLKVTFSGVGIHDQQWDFKHSYVAGQVITREQYGGLLNNYHCLAQPFKSDASKFTNSLPVGRFPSADFVLKNVLIDRREPEDPVSVSKGLLDAIGAPTGVRVRMFTGENFRGNLILDEIGPFIIYNNFWVERDDYRDKLWNNVIKRNMRDLGYYDQLEMTISDLWKLRPSLNDGSKLGFLPKAGTYLKSFGIYDTRISWAKYSWQQVGSILIEYAE